MNEEFDEVAVKKEINNMLWVMLPRGTPLQAAEQCALELLGSVRRTFMENKSPQHNIGSLSH